MLKLRKLRKLRKSSSLLLCNVKVRQIFVGKDDCAKLVSISSTFYARIFRAFLSLEFGFEQTFVQKKLARKMLMKLIPISTAHLHFVVPDLEFCQAFSNLPSEDISFFVVNWLFYLTISLNNFW